MALVHHELCFGCGRQNVFGLLLDVEETAPNVISGRWFVKQDHQGPDPGNAHTALIAAALVEAMAFAGGVEARLACFEVEVQGNVEVGTFVDVEAGAQADHVEATARAGGDQLARATGTLSPWRSP